MALLPALQRHRVDYVLVGGVALGLHGLVGATEDVVPVTDGRSRRCGCPVSGCGTVYCLGGRCSPDQTSSSGSHPGVREFGCRLTAAHPAIRHRRVAHLAGRSDGDQAMSWLNDCGAGGELTPDDQTAAVAKRCHARMHTAGTDFARFPGVLWKTPLR